MYVRPESVDGVQQPLKFVFSHWLTKPRDGEWMQEQVAVHLEGRLAANRGRHAIEETEDGPKKVEADMMVHVAGGYRPALQDEGGKVREAFYFRGARVWR